MTLTGSKALFEAADKIVIDTIEVVVPGETFRLTTAGRAVSVDGMTFQPGDVRLSINAGEVVIALPDQHPLALRSAGGGVRPRQADVNIRRIDEDGAVLFRWSGEVVAIEFNDAHVELRAESKFSLALRKPLGIVLSRSCPHKLFDAGCRLDRKTYARPATVVSIDHGTIVLDIVLAADWARGGELNHLRTTERVEIVEQVPHTSGSVIKLQARPYNLRPGDSVELTPGCDGAIVTCRDKFNNVINFGGAPHLPIRNPFEPD